MIFRFEDDGTGFDDSVDFAARGIECGGEGPRRDGERLCRSRSFKSLTIFRI